MTLACREWYCQEKSVAATYLSKLITGWLPGLLLTLWQNMVLPLTMLLLVQVRALPAGTCHHIPSRCELQNVGIT